MPQEKNKNTYSAPTRQVEKSPKEKTMATGHTNSLAAIDITKATSLEEQALIIQNNLENDNSPAASVDTFSNYYPGKYSQNNFVAEKQKEVKQKEGYINSYVGDFVSNLKKGVIANLGNDVAFVQDHLNRLGILSDKDYVTEKPNTNIEVSKSKIPKTIEAINWFQSKVLHYNTKYGYIIPGKDTITKLVGISVEEKDTKYKEYLEKEKAKQKRIAKQKAKAEKEAEIERIKNEPVTIENLTKIYNKLGSIEALGKFLTDYVQFNPKFVLKAYDLMGFGESDNLTRAIMYNLKDSEIEKLPDALNTKFYESLDAGWTGDEEYSLMAKLKAGKNNKESEVESTNKKTSESLKFEKVDEKYKSGLPILYGSRNNFNKYLRKTELKGDVGKDSGSEKAPNNKEDVVLVKNKLMEKGFEVKSEKLSDLIIQIEAFQLTFLKKDKVDGNISPKGATASKLGLNVSQNSIGSLSRTKDSKGEYSYSEGTDEKEYYSKTTLITENITKDGSKEEDILKAAQEAATNENYYKSITKDLNEKLDWSYKDKDGQSPKKENEGNKLSSVLEERMKRFHKFCVALGIYKGNMLVTNAVRSQKKSHKWSAEHFILYNNKQDHWKSIKSNLIEMYNNPNYRDGSKVKDLDGNIWAKQLYFIFDKNDINKEKAIDINYPLVKNYVNDKNYRSNKKSIAAEGYISGNRRLPLPISGRPGRSKHITGDAIDINSNGFINKNDAIIDLIAINFGVVRCASGEQWHFECADLRVSSSEQELVEHEKR